MQNKQSKKPKCSTSRLCSILQFTRHCEPPVPIFGLLRQWDRRAAPVSLPWSSQSWSGARRRTTRTTAASSNEQKLSDRLTERKNSAFDLIMEDIWTTQNEPLHASRCPLQRRLCSHVCACACSLQSQRWWLRGDSGEDERSLFAVLVLCVSVIKAAQDTRNEETRSSM